jgi:hypothetical protein
MGYLDKSTITVDAILTKRGRAKLAAGTFEIKKFALADDEVDYTLWDENHGKGTNYYGQAIENLPMVEAVPDESKVMRYKLMTLDKNIQKLPFLVLTPSNATFPLNHGSMGTITAKTTTGGGADSADLFYTAIISNGNLARFGDTQTYDGSSISFNFPIGDGTAQIQFTGNNLTTTVQTTTITIIGGTTGITSTVALSINPQAVALG